MAEKLTAQQLEAVTNRGGRLLVSAAAGSGKTKVLVDRLMNYLLDPMEPANLDDFLIITYTKAAATELRGKIAANFLLCGNNHEFFVKKLAVLDIYKSTFFCYNDKARSNRVALCTADHRLCGVPTL